MELNHALMGAVVAMGGAIGVLWRVVIAGYKKLQANYEKLEHRTEICEKDRIELWKQVAELKGKS